MAKCLFELFPDILENAIEQLMKDTFFYYNIRFVLLKEWLERLIGLHLTNENNNTKYGLKDHLMYI